jgi:glutamate racemase
VRELRRLLPGEDLIYFGDTGRVPYGSRSPEIILKYARQDVRFLKSFDLKAIIIACGTVSTTSLDALQAENDLPIVGVVEPTCRRALEMTKNKKVGIIATRASIRSGAYESVLRQMDSEVEVIGQSCPLFVPLVENGFIKVPNGPGLGIESLNEELLSQHINENIPGMWEPTEEWDKEFSNDRIWS